MFEYLVLVSSSIMECSDENEEEEEENGDDDGDDVRK